MDNIVPIGSIVKTSLGERIGVVVDFMACHDGNRYKVKLIGSEGFVEADTSFFIPTKIKLIDNPVLH